MVPLSDKEYKMEKPKKSIFVYLIGVYLFFLQSILSSPLRERSREYFEATGEPYYQNNLILTIISVISILSIIQIIRYKKVFFYLSAVLFGLFNVWILYLIIFVYKNAILRLDILFIINILCIIFFLLKQNLALCDSYKLYYDQKKQEKEMYKRMK